MWQYISKLVSHSLELYQTTLAVKKFEIIILKKIDFLLFILAYFPLFVMKKNRKIKNF